MKAIVIMVISFVIAGCSVKAKYGCSAPEGVRCKSISEVYRSTNQKNKALKVSVKKKGAEESAKNKKTSDLEARKSKEANPEEPVSIRSAPKILRVWVAPWIDDEGDLHQQSYLYVVVDHGKWAFGLTEVESGTGAKLGLVSDDKHQSTGQNEALESGGNGK